ATTASQPAAPAHSPRPRKPWARPRTALHGAYVSIALLAGLRGLRYGARRADAWPRAAGSGARARGARVARLRCAARLATAARWHPSRHVVDHRSPLGSRLDALERHVGVTEQLVERPPLVLVLVEDAADARVDQHLPAVNARGVRDVDDGVADAGAVRRRLGACV